MNFFELLIFYLKYSTSNCLGEFMKKVTLLFLIFLGIKSQGASLICDTLLTQLMANQVQLTSYGLSISAASKGKAPSPKPLASYQAFGSKLNRDKETFVEICLK